MRDEYLKRAKNKKKKKREKRKMDEKYWEKFKEKRHVFFHTHTQKKKKRWGDTFTFDLKTTMKMR